jgi:hypothetical protein
VLITPNEQSISITHKCRVFSGIEIKFEFGIFLLMYLYSIYLSILFKKEKNKENVPIQHNTMAQLAGYVGEEILEGRGGGVGGTFGRWV